MICLSVIVIIGCKKKKNEEESVLNPITAMAASAVNSTITVHWTPPTNSTPTEYKLYKDDVFIQTLTDTIFTENALSTGVFTYCVSAVYGTTESTKACIGVIVVYIPIEDHAEVIAGSYMGEISIPASMDVFPDVVIDLNYVQQNVVNVYMEDVITVSNIEIPLNLNEPVAVHYNSENNNYNFSFTTIITVNIMEQDYTFPLVGYGIVNEDEIPQFTLNITVQTGIIGDLEGIYTGYKQ